MERQGIASLSPVEGPVQRGDGEMRPLSLKVDHLEVGPLGTASPIEGEQRVAVRPHLVEGGPEDLCVAASHDARSMVRGCDSRSINTDEGVAVASEELANDVWHQGSDSS